MDRVTLIDPRMLRKIAGDIRRKYMVDDPTESVVQIAEREYNATAVYQVCNFYPMLKGLEVSTNTYYFLLLKYLYND